MSDVCCSRYLNLSCNPDSAPRSPAYASPEAYLGLLAAPVALIIWLGRKLHPPPPPPLSEGGQLPGGGPDQIPKAAIAEDAHKVRVAAAVSSSVPRPAEPYHCDDEAWAWEEGAAARRFRFRYLEASGADDHRFDPGSSNSTASADPRSDELTGIRNKMVSALSGIHLDIHSSDESTIHPANGVLIDAFQYVCANTEMVLSVLATGDYTIQPYSHMVDFWAWKLVNDAERIFQGEPGRMNIFLLNNIYDVWQIMRSSGASFSSVEVVSRLISMIQQYRRSYFDVCWVPLSNQRRLNKFTAEFLITSSQQMTWKVTAELKYNLRQQIVDFIVPPYEASLLAMQAKRSRLLGVIFSAKRVVAGKKKQKKYTGEELENVIRELFEG